MSTDTGLAETRSEPSMMKLVGAMISRPDVRFAPVRASKMEPVIVTRAGDMRYL
jgi:hypothetical protein